VISKLCTRYRLREHSHPAKIKGALPSQRYGFKSFWAARCTIAGIEVMHALPKGQLATTESMPETPAEQFYALAA